MSNSKFGIHAGINNTSLGQISFQILHELFICGETPFIFPIGQPELSSQLVPNGFMEWLNEGIRRGITEWNKKYPVIKNWHLSQGVESYSDTQILLSYFELDKATPAEINCVKNNYKVLFPSEYSAKSFIESGRDNVSVINLPFDYIHFKNKEVKYPDNRIVFGIFGKSEKRKHSLKALQTWAAEFGDNFKYFLNVSIYNQFLDPQVQSNMILQALGGRQYGNINFLPFSKTNIEYNKVLNNSHIVIGASGGEAFGSPEFHSLALGKHGVIHDCHGYQNFATKQNSVLFDPVGLEPVYDDIFFRQGQLFNQGNIFSWDASEFILSCHKAIDRVNKNKINTEGLKLQQRTPAKFVDELLGYL